LLTFFLQKSYHQKSSGFSNYRKISIYRYIAQAEEAAIPSEIVKRPFKAFACGFPWTGA
jgi:hypothetical protein